MWLINILVKICLVLAPFAAAGLTSQGFVLDQDFEEYDYMNLSVDPCDDFYEYTCGNFKNLNPLKNQQIIIDQFSLLEDKLTSVVNEILTSEVSDEDPIALQKAKAAYQACTDPLFLNNNDLKFPELEIINKYGGFPIIHDEKTMEENSFGWNEIAEIASEFGINIFFTPSLFFDITNASRNILQISSDAMDIPIQFRTSVPQSYEDAIEEGFFDMINSRTAQKGLKKAYGATIPQMELLLRKFVLKIKRHFRSNLSDEYLFDRVANISNFMKGIYAGGYIPKGTKVEPVSEGAQMTTLGELNKWTRKQFGNRVQIDWVEYVKRLVRFTHLDVDENFLISTPYLFNNTLYGILNWVSMNDPAIVKSTALLRAFIYMASDSDSETRNDFEVYLRATNKTVYSRPEYCTRKIMDATGTLSLGLAVTYEYQKNHFDKSKLQNALQLITDLQSSFKEIIEEADWMDDSSKEAAQRKADNIINLLGYPEFITRPSELDKFYENLPISTWHVYENSKNLRAFQQTYLLNMINYRDRKSWEKSPFDSNAYYNRQNNRIIFPVAMLNPIFFKGTGNSLVDYSRIGMIIAHEITHGFDDQGRLYNPDGVIEPWWTTETNDNFKNKTECFKKQYSNYYIPELNSTISGNGSLNENLADNGGLRTSYKALTKLLPRLKKQYGALPRTNQFTSEQLFFVGYGTMWCNNEAYSYKEAIQKSCNTTTSCHFLAKWRVNGVVSNMEEFSAAFNCPIGSPMNPPTKCRLW